MHGYRRHPLSNETQKVPASRRGLLFFIIIVILLAIAGCSRYVLIHELSQDPQAYDPVTLEPVKPDGFLQRMKHFVFSKDVSLEGQRKDRINLLLLGQGGPGHDGPFLTDTIILASIRPSTIIERIPLKNTNLVIKNFLNCLNFFLIFLIYSIL